MDITVFTALFPQSKPNGVVLEVSKEENYTQHLFWHFQGIPMCVDKIYREI